MRRVRRRERWQRWSTRTGRWRLIAERQGLTERRVRQLLAIAAAEGSSAQADEPEPAKQLENPPAPRARMTRRTLLDRAWIAMHLDRRLWTMDGARRMFWLEVRGDDPCTWGWRRPGVWRVRQRLRKSNRVRVSARRQRCRPRSPVSSRPVAGPGGRRHRPSSQPGFEGEGEGGRQPGSQPRGVGACAPHTKCRESGGAGSTVDAVGYSGGRSGSAGRKFSR